jgi:hypothetical protein
MALVDDHMTVSRDQIVGVPKDTEGKDEHAPWNRTPSRKAPKKKVAGKFPARTHAVLAQRIFVEKKDLPTPFLTRINRLPAFQNPMFYEKQSLRISAGGRVALLTHTAHPKLRKNVLPAAKQGTEQGYFFFVVLEGYGDCGSEQDASIKSFVLDKGVKYKSLAQWGQKN